MAGAEMRSCRLIVETAGAEMRPRSLIGEMVAACRSFAGGREPCVLLGVPSPCWALIMLAVLTPYKNLLC